MKRKNQINMFDTEHTIFRKWTDIEEADKFKEQLKTHSEQLRSSIKSATKNEDKYYLEICLLQKNMELLFGNRDHYYIFDTTFLYDFLYTKDHGIKYWGINKKENHITMMLSPIYIDNKDANKLGVIVPERIEIDFTPSNNDGDFDFIELLNAVGEGHSNSMHFYIEELGRGIPMISIIPCNGEYYAMPFTSSIFDDKYQMDRFLSDRERFLNIIPFTDD